MSVVCVLPPRQYVWRATERLIADVGRFCEELGFGVASVKGLGSFVAALLRGRVVIVLYPGFLSPVARSFLELLYKLFYLFVYLFFAVVLGRRFILYVYDLPIEQNLAVWGRVPHVGLSRVFERLFFRFSSVLLVFNWLNVVYLSKIYGLDRRKFSLFEVLDYGADISGDVEVCGGFSRCFYVIYAANFNPLVRNSFSNFVKSCRTDFVKFFAVGKGAESLEVAVGKLPEVDSAYLPVVYRYFHFGLVLKSSWYYEFTSTSKFASYVHAGLPVLVPEEYRYLCSVVKRFGVGLCFKDCKDLAQRLRDLRPEEYESLRRNAARLGFLLRRGYFFKKALFRALGHVKGKLFTLPLVF